MAPTSLGSSIYGMLALVAIHMPSAAQELPKMDSTWTVSVHGQTIPVNDDGSFSVPNVSSADQFGAAGPGSAPDFVSDEFLRVIGVSTAGGVTRYAYSELFRIARGQRISVGQMTISDTAPPFPQRVRSTPDDAVLTSAGQSTLVRVTGTLLDGSLLDVTGSAAGTTYRTSNPMVLSVDSEGLATAVGDGRAFVTATNEGAATVSSVLVALGDPLTQVIGFVQLEDGTPGAGATVTVAGQGQSATTGADGRFTIDDVATTLGNLRVQARLSSPQGVLTGVSDDLVPVGDGLTDAGVTVVTPSMALNIGLIANRDSNSVVVFESIGDTILGVVNFPTFGVIVGDCSITPDGTLGFVTNFNDEVWVIDLTQQPPALAAGTNPIPISNNGEDTTVTADGKYLLVCDGSNPQPVSVVDIASRQEISTFTIGSSGCNSVEICPDGSVLVTSVDDTVRRLILDAAGNLTATGEVLATSGDPGNTICAGGSMAGIVVLRPADSIVSFLGPGLLPVDTRALTGNTGLSAIFTPSGDRAFIRSSSGIDAFDFDPLTATLSAMPVFSISVAFVTPYFGIDMLGMNPDGSRFYASDGNQVNIFSTLDGSLLGSITDPAIVSPLGVVIR